MSRKQFSKIERRKVFDKCNGHCAYCGCELTLKTMQVDHIESVFIAEYWERKEVDNSLDNLLPSCRQCNFYKGAMSLEFFRTQLKTLMERVRKPFIFRLAEKYGMLQELKWDGKFYFERIKQLQSKNNKPS